MISFIQLDNPLSQASVSHQYQHQTTLSYGYGLNLYTVQPLQLNVLIILRYINYYYGQVVKAELIKSCSVVKVLDHLL